MAQLDENIRSNLSGIKRIIGVYSGKGGVGKTTIAINFAAHLAQQGYRVCVLDADIDCPNVNRALGISGEFDIRMRDRRILPHERHNLKVISMASLQKAEDEALVWRGPLLTDTLMKFLGSTVWGTADYLIIDLPPGTSDIPLTIMKFLQPDGILLITTPRSIAEVDARKSANLAKMTEVTVLGVIENMSGEPFGTGAGKKCATAVDAPYLGEIAFDACYMESIDAGYPAVTKHTTAQSHFDTLLTHYFAAEEKHLGNTLPKPHKGVMGKAKRLMQDLKDELK